MKKFASANWKGSGKEGSGHLSTESEVLNKTPYTFKTRFEGEKGTNPEELIAAAHAGCFTMQLSFNLNRAGFVADTIDTKCEITLDTEKKVISGSHLIVNAKVPVISPEKLMEIAEDAKTNCIISKLLHTQITMEIVLA